MIKGSSAYKMSLSNIPDVISEEDLPCSGQLGAVCSLQKFFTTRNWYNPGLQWNGMEVLQLTIGFSHLIMDSRTQPWNFLLSRQSQTPLGKVGMLICSDNHSLALPWFCHGVSYYTALSWILKHAGFHTCFGSKQKGRHPGEPLSLFTPEQNCPQLQWVSSWPFCFSPHQD